MSNPMTLIGDIDAAISAHRPDDGATALSEVERQLSQQPPDPESAMELKAAIARLMARTQAAADGVALARAQIEQIIRLAEQFESYDQSGNRLRKRLTDRASQKF